MKKLLGKLKPSNLMRAMVDQSNWSKNELV